MRRYPLVLLFLLFTTVAAAQIGNPLSCTASAAVPPMVRAGGLTELTGDIVLLCTGGVPTPAGNIVPAVNLTVSLNTNITSRLLAGNWTEALLLIDEPGSGLPFSPSSQLVCGAPTAPEVSPGVCTITGTGGTDVYSGSPGRPNVFQAVGSGNSVTFRSLPFDPPGSGIRVLRIVNTRANALLLGVPNPIPEQVMAYVAVSGALPIPINNPTQVVGFSMPEVSFSLTPAPPIFQQSVSQNPELAHSSKANGTSQFSVRVQEAFATAFKPRTMATYVDADTSPMPASQNAPGTIYNSETGFFNPSFPTIAHRGNLGRAGLADFGTRIMVKFSDVPAGVSLYTGAVVNLNSGGVLRRVDSDSGAFNPSAAGAYGIVPVSVKPSTGQGFAVYEVLAAHPSMLETADIPVYVAYVAKGNGKNKLAGTANVSVSLAPVSAVGQASLTGPMPQFGGTSVPVTAFTIAP